MSNDNIYPMRGACGKHYLDCNCCNQNKSEHTETMAQTTNKDLKKIKDHKKYIWESSNGEYNDKESEEKR